MALSETQILNVHPVFWWSLSGALVWSGSEPRADTARSRHVCMRVVVRFLVWWRVTLQRIA
jgi:hypothetical protein